MDPAGKDYPCPAVWTAETSTQLADAYQGWSASYDKDLAGLNFKAPILVAKSLATLYKTDRQTVKILDVGAGTGLVGVELQKLGFQTVDGLDPSKPMLEKARSTHAYCNLICQYFTAEPTPGLEKDSYDVIISCGSLLSGHLPPDCFIEAARLVKPGGIICMITRTEGTGSFSVPGYGNQFKAVIRRLEEEIKLKEMKWEKVNYFNNTEGILMTNKVLQ